ncbi:hypothetical protein [Pseudarthrobacter sp. MM222]|uniref:hypothetical protein n=1 Tax=Pseudarthrobacter sp. MM222 TaxID=3018929 RepID=UPI00221F46B7|nr:hypothetical protein [Pseudarthrobacter sp. MM222]CAI3791990.1 hypothetical protein NKCBBBOE_00434 [Pseudarthrobacter sp. MM222]
MIATDFITAGVFICLALGVGILIYAVSKGVKIDDGKHKALLVGVWSAMVIHLILGGLHIRFVSQK